MNPLIGHKVRREQLKPGDHIYAWRFCNLYAHHGIYMGDEMVIQFTAANGQKHIVEGIVDEFNLGTCKTKKCKGFSNRTINGIMITCLDCFLHGGNSNIYRYDYGVRLAMLIFTRPGVCAMDESDPPDMVLGRADSCLHDPNGFGVYNFTGNNCEDFAFYCKTGKRGAKLQRGQKCQAFFPRLVGEVKDVIIT